MDSGRTALLEKAREFGSLAHEYWSFGELLEKTVTYRTLALYLGIQNEWWDEFWRSFSFALQCNGGKLKKVMPKPRRRANRDPFPVGSGRNRRCSIRKMD